MRAHYERLFREAKTRGETQETIAERGGLKQNQISRMFAIATYGPQVENFVKAIEGLGLSVSSFFAQIERKTDGDLSIEPRPSSTALPQIGAAPSGDRRAVSIDSTKLTQAGERLVEVGLLLQGAAADAANDGDVAPPVPKAKRVRRTQPHKSKARRAHG